MVVLIDHEPDGNIDSGLKEELLDLGLLSQLAAEFAMALEAFSSDL